MEVLWRFTRRYYSSVISSIKKERNYPQFLAYRPEFNVQPNGLLGLATRLVILPPVLKTVQDELHKEDEVFGVIDSLVARGGRKRVNNDHGDSNACLQNVHA